MNTEKLVIVGSGPAGWTAAIYAARANLNPLVYEGEITQELLPGGQLMFTNDVDNFPGFPDGIRGPELMENMKTQAKRFAVKSLTESIRKLDLSKKPYTLIDSKNNEVKAHSIIIATGAKANWLGLPNEKTLSQKGGGVSACAICDGALPVYRDKELAVVGGGDTAIEEATYLTKFASKVHIIHRRDTFRASFAMQKHLENNKKIQIHWNKTVTEIIGNDFIEELNLEDTKTKEKSKLKVGGFFVAIGHTPITAFLKGQVELTEEGYIKIFAPFRTYTSTEGVFAAGDVIDSYYRQAITSAGTGCMAALDAERWLSKEGII